MHPRNLLIFHSGALGDFVLSWPLGLALGRLHPQSRVIYVTARQKGDLVERVLRLEACDVESGWHHLFGDVANLPDPCRRKLQGAHGVFTFVAKAGDPWLGAVSSVAPQARVVPVDVLPPHGYTAHASQRLLDALAEHPAAATAVRQILASIAATGIAAGSADRRGPIIIHPGSGSPQKCWPLESYLRVADAITRGGRSCTFILGEVELDRWPGDAIRRIEAAAQTTRPRDYLQLLEQLRGGGAFVGNDSGPAHLAGIIGTPSVVLFGPTDPAVWKPLGPRVSVLRKQPLDALDVQEVYAAVVTAAG
jgi:heptosyltransferase-3